MRNSVRESYLDHLHKGADKMQQNVLFEMLKKDMTIEIVNKIKALLKGIFTLSNQNLTFKRLLQLT